MNTQPFSQTSQKIELCCEYLSVCAFDCMELSCHIQVSECIHINFVEIFLECEVQQENNNSATRHWPSTGKDINLVSYYFRKVK